MDSEQNIIKSILRYFPKSKNHLNDFFDSDAEVISVPDSKLLISIDSYTEEDHFRTENPEILGHNLAVCTMSDIFACGGLPVFFGNSLSCSKSWDTEFIQQLSKGIAKALNHCNCGFIGGDFGYSDNWSFTGVVLGKCGIPVSRRGASDGDLIYLSGNIGSGNFEAASQLKHITKGLESLFDKTKVVFNIRDKESILISKYAACCIDTSDGLINSLKIIAELNNVGYAVSDIPYFQPGLILTENLSLPKELLAFGECGEYELLFTVKKEHEDEFLLEAHKENIDVFKIGSIKSGNAMEYYSGTKWINVNDLNISAREFKNHYDYITELNLYLKSKFEYYE